MNVRSSSARGCFPRVGWSFKPSCRTALKHFGRFEFPESDQVQQASTSTTCKLQVIRWREPERERELPERREEPGAPVHRHTSREPQPHRKHCRKQRERSRSERERSRSERERSRSGPVHSRSREERSRCEEPSSSVCEERHSNVCAERHSNGYGPELLHPSATGRRQPRTSRPKPSFCDSLQILLEHEKTKQ